MASPPCRPPLLLRNPSTPWPPFRTKNEKRKRTKERKEKKQKNVPVSALQNYTNFSLGQPHLQLHPGCNHLCRRLVPSHETAPLYPGCNHLCQRPSDKPHDGSSSITWNCSTATVAAATNTVPTPVLLGHYWPLFLAPICCSSTVPLTWTNDMTALTVRHLCRCSALIPCRTAVTSLHPILPYHRLVRTNLFLS